MSKKMAPYKVFVAFKGGEVRSGEVGSLKEARETAQHFRDHGQKADIYKWNVDDQRYLRIRGE